MFAKFLKRLGDWAQFARRLQGDLAHVVVRPHHPLGHSGGAAGIDKELILARAPNIQRPAIAVIGQGLKSQGEGSNLAVRTDLDPGLYLRQARSNLCHCATKFRGIDHRLGVGIVENVPDFLWGISIIDVHMRHPRFEGGGQAQHIFRPVAHIDRQLVTRLAAARDQGVSEIVSHPRGLAPGDPPLAMDKRRSVRRQRRLNGVQDIPEIPTHGVSSPYGVW